MKVDSHKAGCRRKDIPAMQVIGTNTIQVESKTVGDMKWDEEKHMETVILCPYCNLGIRPMASRNCAYK